MLKHDAWCLLLVAAVLFIHASGGVFATIDFWATTAVGFQANDIEVNSNLLDVCLTPEMIRFDANNNMHFKCKLNDTHV